MFPAAPKEDLLVPGVYSRWVAAVFGIISALLGGVVMIGWHAHLTSLIQMRPTMAPMQYNTALCFLLAGAGLVTLALRLVRFTQALGGVIAVVAALTMSEYLFTADLGIDQLLFRADITTANSHAGRMSQLTTVCFLQAGLALLLCGFPFARKLRMPIIGSLASVVIALSAMAALGYAVGLPGIYGWGLVTRTPLHTASGLCLLGIGLFALAWNAGRERGQRTPRWLPVPFGLGIFAGSLALSQALVIKQHQDIAQTVKARAGNATSQISTRIAGRMKVLMRMAEHWGFAGRPPQAEWEHDAKNLLRDNPEFQALEWIDASHLIQWIVPLEGNEAKLHLDRLPEGPRRTAAEMAAQQHRPAITSGVELFHGSLGFNIYVPVYIGPKFDGWIAAVFQAQPILARYLPPAVAEGVAIRISEGTQTLYERSPGPLPAHPEWIADSHIELPGTTWEVRVWPTPASLARLDSPLPLIGLAIGVLASLLIAFTIFFAQRASAEAREILKAQAEIKVLSGLLSICAECKRIRDEAGHWNRMERYVSKRSGASFSHGLCPICAVGALEKEGLEVPESFRKDLAKGDFDP
jgi:sensor domain CHASE-containing protein